LFSSPAPIPTGPHAMHCRRRPDLLVRTGLQRAVRGPCAPRPRHDARAAVWSHHYPLHQVLRPAACGARRPTRGWHRRRCREHTVERRVERVLKAGASTCVSRRLICWEGVGGGGREPAVGCSLASVAHSRVDRESFLGGLHCLLCVSEVPVGGVARCELRPQVFGSHR
jgi:hypothetical protein